MSEATSRRRAPAMSPEQRREMIVRAALPLVVEYGTSVTTAQVARAAGIGEGTIFRAFGDKDALLAACMAEAARPDDTLAHVAAISLELPLAERLIEASEALRGYLSRMGAVAGALAASGGLRREFPAAGPRKGPGSESSGGTTESASESSGDTTESASESSGGTTESGKRAMNGREASMAATREVLAGLFEPERDRLRLDPERLAEAFQFMTMASGRGVAPLTSAELVELFLHGAYAAGGREN
ncbi:TetR/AcrR family transcriptional regulator [Nonomuraea fuscirosea]|uniref:TetR/AcrR family transcriptional regulator n=1 Tax=Nonomuraea fuscirosea TaxID=1291556 RepID=UPI002DDAB797|nr:TetR family transcriptional regulator [Nonomuraea fuscirosea]WSA52780.1 TetR/AcrR family transcriptional regulator [Nonomuraea fuscirosea]